MKVNISELLGDEFLQDVDLGEIDNKIYNEGRLIFDRIDRVIEYYKYTLEEEERLDKATQDVLHYIELSENLNAPEGYKAYKLLRDIRRKRRKIKDDHRVIKPLYIALTQTKIHERRSLTLGNMEKACRYTDGDRHYNTRVMTDIFGHTIENDKR